MDVACVELLRQVPLERRLKNWQLASEQLSTIPKEYFIFHRFPMGNDNWIRKIWGMTPRSASLHTSLHTVRWHAKGLAAGRI